MFTPGPWRAEVHDDVMIARVYGRKHHDGGEYAALFETNNKANAHLVAAAPELLSALKAVRGIWYRFHSCSDPNCTVCEETRFLAKLADDAIAKAEGRQ